MSELQIDQLLGALENETNTSIMELTNSKIKKYKNDSLQRVQIKGQELKEMHKKLKEYRYVTDLRDVQFGCYIRWIPLKNPDKIYLTNGGIIIDIDILKNGIHLKVKNNRNRIYQLKFDECIIYQKLTNQEQIILSVLDHLDK
tara:strand:- start:157 stop:585 length:429 start_codon:yes stop_codon:yes gene_type:complete